MTAAPIIQSITEVCAKNTLNLKNVDITKFDEKSVEAKAYFPYHSNKLLLDYFVTEMKKEDAVVDAYIVMKKGNNVNYEGPHES